MNIYLKNIGHIIFCMLFSFACKQQGTTVQEKTEKEQTMDTIKKEQAMDTTKKVLPPKDLMEEMGSFNDGLRKDRMYKNILNGTLYKLLYAIGYNMEEDYLVFKNGWVLFNANKCSDKTIKKYYNQLKPQNAFLKRGTYTYYYYDPNMRFNPDSEPFVLNWKGFRFYKSSQHNRMEIETDSSFQIGDTIVIAANCTGKVFYDAAINKDFNARLLGLYYYTVDSVMTNGEMIFPSLSSKMALRFHKDISQEASNIIRADRKHYPVMYIKGDLLFVYSKLLVPGGKPYIYYEGKRFIFYVKEITGYYHSEDPCADC